MQDYAEAVKWYRKAANQGNAKALPFDRYRFLVEGGRKRPIAPVLGRT